MADNTLFWYFKRLACRSYFSEVTVVQFPAISFRSDIPDTENRTGFADHKVSGRTVVSLSDFSCRGENPKKIKSHNLVQVSMK